MQCEESELLLFSYADNTLRARERDAVGQHLDGCSACQEAFSQIVALKQQAEVWHDESPPAWQPPRMSRQPFDFSQWLQWFPTMASAAALLLAVLVFMDSRAPSVEPAPGASLAATQIDSAAESILVQNVLESSRDQRQRELEALVKLLKAEMDRRSLETEESLRYVIAHQIQDQQDLDELRQELQASEQAAAGGEL